MEDIPEEKVLDEKEERRLKNKEWREKRENRGKCEENTQEKAQEKQLISNLILPELHCQNCHELLAPPSIILQCEDLHKTCQGCQGGGDTKVRFKICCYQLLVSWLKIFLYLGRGVKGFSCVSFSRVKSGLPTKIIFSGCMEVSRKFL